VQSLVLLRDEDLENETRWQIAACHQDWENQSHLAFGNQKDRGRSGNARRRRRPMPEGGGMSGPPKRRSLTPAARDEASPMTDAPTKEQSNSEHALASRASQEKRDPECVIAIIAKNKRERVRVALDAYRGVDLVDIRVLAQLDDPSGLLVATKKGVSLKIEQLPELISALRAAEAVARARGLLSHRMAEA
jgi:hypothetical protein